MQNKKHQSLSFKGNNNRFLNIGSALSRDQMKKVTGGGCPGTIVLCTAAGTGCHVNVDSVYCCLFQCP